MQDGELEAIGIENARMFASVTACRREKKTQSQPYENHLIP
jgi:hypothetical protein